MPERIRILFLAANSPADNSGRLAREAREIEQKINSSEHRDSFEFIYKGAVRPSDLQEVLLRHQPHIVHLSGRGSEAQGIILTGDDENSRPVETSALAELFRILKDHIRLIVFNASYAHQQAQALNEIVDYAVGMGGAIEDETAIIFSVSFYQALAYARSVRVAFELAQNAPGLEGKSGLETPTLWVRSGVDEAQPFLPPESERSMVAGESAATALDSLRQVRRLSEIAAQDAQFIGHNALTLGGDLRLDQLYVHRIVEERIDRILSREESVPTFILIVGEAGHGKTSLLWHLYSALNRRLGWEPWFIKSTLFLERGGPQPASSSLATKFDADSLLRAAQAAVSSGLRPVVCLDTVDLLLRSEADRQFLLELILTLRDRDCFVVATCRPQEAVALYSIKSANIILREYVDDDEHDELREAICKHAERFYAAPIRKNYPLDVQRILDSVARGLPLREVCVNPLTLRMLFSIYAPATIPDDINIFKLYKEYWSQRVVSDYRMGSSPIASVASPNLEQTAAAVALAMLAEGTPDLDRHRLDSALKELGCSSAEVEALVSRAVLHASEVGSISYFHQTFFEHSAARGLLMRQGDRGRALLYERMQTRPHDLFLASVYEQVLLLSEHETGPILKEAEKALVRLLESESQPFKASGMYVYCHRQQVAAATVEAMRKILAEAEESLIIRFLTLAPNISDRRLKTLFAELDVIWNRGKWREHEHSMKLLERLVPRDFEEVERFIERHHLLEYLLGTPVGSSGDWKLLRLLSALAEYDPAWGLRWLIQLYIKAVPRVKSRELQTAVINTLCDRADLFGASELVTRFETETAHLTLDRSRNFEDLSAAYGRLLSIEWRASRRPISDILEEISRFDGGLKLLARMKALALTLLTVNEDEVAIAFSRFKRECGTPREWMWTRMVWPQILAGRREEASAREAVEADASLSSVRYIRAEALRTFIEESNSRDETSAGRRESEPLAAALRAAIRYAALEPHVLLELLSTPDLSKPEVWLDKDRYAPLLVDAFIAEHPGAVSAMNRLLENPAKYWAEIEHVVSTKLSSMIMAGGRALDSLLTLTLKLEDEVHLLRALEKVDAPAPEAFRRRRDEIAAFRLRLMRSPSGRKRSSATFIWFHLLRLKLAPAPELSELLRRLKEEDDIRNRGQLIKLIGQSAGSFSDEVGGVVEFLEPLARGSDTYLREESLEALVRIVAEAPQDLPGRVMRVLDAALTPPTNAARLSLMRPLIEKLIPDHVRLAEQVFSRLLLEAQEAGLGLNGSRKILGRMKFMLRTLVRAAPLDVRRELLSLVPRLDWVLGMLIVDAICHEDLSGLAPELEELLKVDGHSDVKGVVLRYKYMHERTKGGEDWPELYRLIND